MLRIDLRPGSKPFARQRRPSQHHVQPDRQLISLSEFPEKINTTLACSRIVKARDAIPDTRLQRQRERLPVSLGSMIGNLLCNDTHCALAENASWVSKFVTDYLAAVTRKFFLLSFHR